jgi:hypothetical protein
MNESIDLFYSIPNWNSVNNFIFETKHNVYYLN